MNQRAGLGLVIATGLAMWGGLTVRHAITCHRLEADYLGSVASLREAGLMHGLGIHDAELNRRADGLESLAMDAAKQALRQLFDECGRLAVETANRKGSDILLGE